MVMILLDWAGASSYFWWSPAKGTRMFGPEIATIDSSRRAQPRSRGPDASTRARENPHGRILTWKDGLAGSELLVGDGGHAWMETDHPADEPVFESGIGATLGDLGHEGRGVQEPVRSVNR